MELDVPEPVLLWLLADCSLTRNELLAEHPDLPDQVATPEIREALIGWLGVTDRTPNEPMLIVNILRQLRPQATEAEGQTVRALLGHPAPSVRQHAYDYMITLYFPDRNRPALLALYQAMLGDEDDSIRAAGVRSVERAEASAELGGALAQWRASAEERGWAATESHELVDRLLRAGEEEA